MSTTEVATAEVFSKTVNGIRVDDLCRTVDAIKAAPSIAKFNFRIHNQWVDAAKNRSAVDMFYGAGQEQLRSKPFVLEADEPPVLLGTDTLPIRSNICSMPWELV